MSTEDLLGNLTPLEQRCLRFLLYIRSQAPLRAPVAITLDSLNASAGDLPPIDRQPFDNPRAWRGITAEAQLVAAALSRKLGIAFPYGSGWLPFDFFIFTAWRTYRAQVKYGSFGRNASWKVCIRRRGNTSLYKKGDFHILAVTGPNGLWYFIPYDRLGGRRSLSIPRRKRMMDNAPSFPIHKYRERWDLFK